MTFLHQTAMAKLEKQPHIYLDASQVLDVVIVTGDPNRAEHIAQFCSSHEELATNREYRSFKCKYNSQEFMVISHGIGSAGAAICFEELIKNGAKVLIRAGTAGSLQPDRIRTGDIVICHSAAREDGVTERYVPKGFPAVADSKIVRGLKEVGKSLKIPTIVGGALTCDLFYESPVIPGVLEQYSKAKIDIVDMELGTLLTIAKIRGVMAGGLCTIDGCPLRADQEDYDPHGELVADAKLAMLRLVLEAAAEFVRTKIWVEEELEHFW